MPGPTGSGASQIDAMASKSASLTTSSSAAAVTAFWSPRIPALASAMVFAPV